MTSVTISKNLQSAFGLARDQGQRPTCLAFATSDLHAALRGAWEPLSCEYIFYHAQRRAGRQATQGAFLPFMLEALREDGQPHETAWQYLDVVPTDIAQWCPPAGITSLFRRAGEPGEDTVDAIVQELNHDRPVLTLMTLSSSFDWASGADPIFAKPNEPPDPFRRHAVVAVGHGTAGKQRAILVRNSWGSGWGASGYAWLAEDFLSPRILRLAKLKEDLSVPSSSAST